MITYLQEQKSLMVKLSSASSAFKLVLTKLLSQRIIVDAIERRELDAYYDMYSSAYENCIEDEEFAEAFTFISNEVDKLMECQVNEP